MPGKIISLAEVTVIEANRLPNLNVNYRTTVDLSLANVN